MTVRHETPAARVRAAGTIIAGVCVAAGGAVGGGCLYVEEGRAGIQAESVALAPAYGAQAMGAPGVVPLLGPGRATGTAIVFADSERSVVAR